MATDDVTMKPAEEKKAEETPATQADAAAEKTEKTTEPAKTEEAAPAEPEPAKPKFEEKEKDNKEEKGNRPVLRNPVCLNSLDTTLNCVVDIDGVTASPVAVDGFHLLVAQARANYGVKRGRYLFEAQVLESSVRPEIKIGISTASAPWVGGKGSIAFDQRLQLHSNGESAKQIDAEVPLIKKDDVIGILINLVAKSPNKNTISLFLNGKRVVDAQAIPADMCKEALFPHISVKNCSLGMNFLSQWKALDFTVYMIGQAVSADLEKTKVLPCTSAAKMVVPVGLDTNEYVEELGKSENYFTLSRAYLEEWVKQSGHAKKAEGMFGIVCLDNIKYVAPWIRSRPRNMIWCPGEVLFAEERKKQMELFPTFEKIAHINGMTTIKMEKTYHQFQDATFPTEEEGFNSISFVTPQEDAEKALAGWKLNQKLRSKVENLKVGTSFAERLEVFKNYRSVTKETEEGKLFTEEDWMLATLRAEFICLLNSFKEDVNDETQTSFPLSLVGHYYKEYKGMVLNPLVYGCLTIEEMLKEHLKDCIFIDDDSLLASKLDVKEWENEAVFKLTDAARDLREIWEGVGKEDARLKFAAGKPMRNPNEPQFHQNQDGHRSYQRHQGNFNQHHQQQQSGHHQQQQQQQYGGHHQQHQQQGHHQQQQGHHQGGYQHHQQQRSYGQQQYGQNRGYGQQQYGGQQQGRYQSQGGHGGDSYHRGGQDQGNQYNRGQQGQQYGGGKGGNKRSDFVTHGTPHAQRMRTN